MKGLSFERSLTCVQKAATPFTWAHILPEFKAREGHDRGSWSYEWS